MTSVVVDRCPCLQVFPTTTVTLCGEGFDSRLMDHFIRRTSELLEKSSVRSKTQMGVFVLYLRR